MSEYGEPWRIEFGSILRGDPNERNLILGGWGDSATSPSFEELRRIVACVNACAGVPTENLSRWVATMKRSLELADSLTESDTPSPMMIEIGRQLWEQFQKRAQTPLAQSEAPSTIEE